MEWLGLRGSTARNFQRTVVVGGGVGVEGAAGGGAGEGEVEEGGEAVEEMVGVTAAAVEARDSPDTGVWEAAGATVVVSGKVAPWPSPSYAPPPQPRNSFSAQTRWPRG